MPLGGAASLAVLSVAPNVAVMLLGWCGVQATLNAMLAAVTAMIPDQVPGSRRGRIGGIVAVAQTIGVVGGTGIAAATGSIAAGYLAIAAFLLVLAIPFSLSSRDLALPPEARPPFDVRRFLASFWISPRLHPDFGWAWLTRFLVNLGNALGTPLPPLLPAGRDRLQLRRGRGPGLRAHRGLRPHAGDDHGRLRRVERPAGPTEGVRDLVGAGRRARAAILLGVGQTWPAALAAAVVMGCAYGIYTAVDFALITQVLPTAIDRAKDLGVINIANALPQVVAPVLAGVLLWLVESAGGVVESDGDGFSAGYLALYLLAFLASVLGSVFVTRIRGVR